MKSQIWKFFYWPALWFLALWPWQPSSHFLPKLTPLFRTIGAILMSYGLLIHIVAGKTLKKLGHSAGNKSIWPDVLVTKGIYATMRHPQHLGLILIPLGLAFIISSLQAFLGAGWTVAGALVFLILIEEPECLEKFHTSYFDYMARTPPFSLRPGAILYGIRFLKDLRDKT